MLDIKEKLENLGHIVFVPSNNKNSNLEFKILKRNHFNQILNSDSILVLNFNKDGIENYIGASTFCEINYAFFENKKIFLLNPIPEQPYINENLKYLDIKVLNQDLNNLN